MATATRLASHIEQRLQHRNQIVEQFFVRESPRLALACREMSERFLRGGRLLAFGRGPYATDGQHVSVSSFTPSSWANALCPRSTFQLFSGPG